MFAFSRPIVSIGVQETENIFVRPHSGGINVQWATCMGFHYNQAPSGWNGFTTLADFYNSFDTSDVRRGIALTGYTNQMGSKVGLLAGLQRGPKGGTSGNEIVDLSEVMGDTKLQFDKMQETIKK